MQRALLRKLPFCIARNTPIIARQHQQHHTLAQNNLCEFWCGMHLTCKNTPTTPDRNGSVKRPEKNWKGTIAMSSARWNKLTDCENRANREIWKQVIWKRHGGSWVGHIPCPKMKQVRDKGVPSSYHHGKAVSSLVDDCQTMHPPPALFRKGEDGRKKKREVLHLFRCYTHTPGQSRVNPERQEEEKSGHTTGRRPKTAQGGEGNRRTSGTNLHGETDLTKTAHTPKPHDTLRRGTRGN